MLNKSFRDCRIILRDKPAEEKFPYWVSRLGIDALTLKWQIIATRSPDKVKEALSERWSRCVPAGKYEIVSMDGVGTDTP